MEKQLTNNTLRETKLDMTKQFYHKNQVYYHTEKLVVAHPRPKHQAENTVEFISADIEFIAELQDSLDQGGILTLSEVETRYNHMMCDHGIQKQITRSVLLSKINQQISNFAITEAKGRKPAVIHSKETVRSAIDAAV